MRVKQILAAAFLALGLELGAVAASIAYTASENADQVSADGAKSLYVNIDQVAWKTNWNATEDDLKIHWWYQGMPEGELDDWPGVGKAETVTKDGLTFARWDIPAKATDCCVVCWSGNKNHDQSGNISLDTGKDNVIYVKGKSDVPDDQKMDQYHFSVTDIDGSETVYVYDSKDYWHGNARCYAWGGKPTVSWPGELMTVANGDYHGGTLYSYTIPKIRGWHNGLFVETGDIDKTANQNLYNNAGKTFIINKSAADSWVEHSGWFANSDRDAAVEFIYDKMKMSSYDSELTGKGDGSCKTYFGAAETAYGSLTENGIQAIDILDVNGNVWDRLAEWADANGKSFSKATGFDGFRGNLVTIQKNDGILIACIVGASILLGGSLAAVCLKKRKRLS